MAAFGLLKAGAAGLSKMGKGKIDPAKFAGKMEDTKKKSEPKGALVPSPGGAITTIKIVDVKPKDPPDLKEEKSGTEGPLAFMWGTTNAILQAIRRQENAKKEKATNDAKVAQKKKRALKEKLGEGGVGKAAMGTAKKLASPVTSIFDSILQGIGVLFAGWLTQYLPQIVGFVEGFIKVVQTVVGIISPVLTPILKGLMWLGKTGVALMAGLLGVDNAGENTAIKNVDELMKKLPLLEAAFAVFAVWKIKNPKPKPKPKLRAKPRIRGGRPPRPRVRGRWFKRVLNRVARTGKKLWRGVKNIVRRPRLLKPMARKAFRETARRIRNINVVQKGKDLLKSTEKFTKNILKHPKRELLKKSKDLSKNWNKNLQSVKNFTQEKGKKLNQWRKSQGLTKKGIQEGAKKVKRSGWFKKGWGAIKKGGQAIYKAGATVGKGAVNLGKATWTGAINLGQGLLDEMTKFASNMKGSFDNIAKGAMDFGANISSKWKEIEDLIKNPQKLMEKARKALDPKMDDLLKKNKWMKELLKIIRNPKSAGPALEKFLTGLQKNKKLLDAANKMKGVSTRFKGALGGMDAIIAAIFGLFDYTVLGESPINALVKALAGLIGYAAGFAIGVPFGGFPGFVTGMAGGIAGEWVGNKLLSWAATTFPDLTTTPDPIMGPVDERAGRPARPWLRDPSGLGDHMRSPNLKSSDKKENKKEELEISARFDLESGKAYINGKEVSMKEYEKFQNMSNKEQLLKYGKPKGESIIPSGSDQVSSDATAISESASYDDRSGKSTIVPVPIDQMTKPNGVVVDSGGTSGTSVNKNEAISGLNKTIVLSTLYRG